MNIVRTLRLQWWWVVWNLALILCLSLWLYFAFTRQNLEIINIEYGVYLSVLALAFVSMLKIRYGKPIIYGLILLFVLRIYRLPELQQIENIRSCIEDKLCEEAVQKGLITSKFAPQKNIIKQ